MEEFIENFNKFKEWLYEQEINWSDSPEEGYAFSLVVKKFEELNLDEAF